MGFWVEVAGWGLGIWGLRVGVKVWGWGVEGWGLEFGVWGVGNGA